MAADPDGCRGDVALPKCVDQVIGRDAALVVRPQPFGQMGPALEEAQDFFVHALRIEDASDRSRRAAQAERGREEVLTG